MCTEFSTTLICLRLTFGAAWQASAVAAEQRAVAAEARAAEADRRAEQAEANLAAAVDRAARAEARPRSEVYNWGSEIRARASALLAAAVDRAARAPERPYHQHQGFSFKGSGFWHPSLSSWSVHSCAHARTDALGVCATEFHPPCLVTAGAHTPELAPLTQHRCRARTPGAKGEWLAQGAVPTVHALNVCMRTQQT